MPSPAVDPVPARRFALSADLWAVALSLLLALLVKLGAIKSVAW